MTEILDSGERRTFDTGAQRDRAAGKGKMSLMPPLALIRVSKHYEAGALKYAARNWEKGMPMVEMIDSALRHLLQYETGDNVEDHLSAAAFNILCAIEYEERIKLGVLPESLFEGMGPLFSGQTRDPSPAR